MTYLKQLLKKLDLCCLQEHWLFKPEQHLLHDIDTNMIVTAKSIDDENPELSMIARRGYGGQVKELTQYVQILDMEAENTSDHVPVIATIKRKLIRKSNKPKSVIVRTKWEKCNLQKYQLTISDGVEKILQASNKNIEEDITSIEKVMHNACNEAIPNYNKSITTKALGNPFGIKNISEASKDY
ncbi:unnamed protein product [Mytilus coruscus]|uniref:Endonuclease/exonuclease/phosphatase domain-containing protein n=1 Tax=Mytilus coruscus TaxID=42192 RepID=A0A6J8EJ12_MYTCO|nr:unnamed protein product [Mytilus coruscus]